MLGFGPDVYVPIVLTKRGERKALATLPASVKNMIRPLFVVHEVDWDYDLGQPKKTLAAHLQALPSELNNCWGSEAFLDASAVGDNFVSGSHPLAWFHSQAASLGMVLTPAVSTLSTGPYLQAVADLVAAGSDVCLRLSVNEWPAGAGPADVDNLLSAIGATPGDCHVVLDMQDDVGAAAARFAASELRTFPYLDDWRSLIVASTAVPENMPPGAGLHVLPRQDWKIYCALRGLTPALPRPPSFGDYVVNGLSIGLDLNPAVMQISATLRYTAKSDWLVAKGQLFKAHGGNSLGGAAVPPAALLLVNHSEFFGANHCEFETWLVPVAAGGNGSSPETWRRYATHHHINVVVEQLANLP